MKKVLITAVIVLSLSVAYAVEAPVVREGLWSIHTTTISNPGNKKTEGNVTLCRDHAYDKATEALANEQKNCTVTREGIPDGYASEARCVLGTTTIETKGRVTYQGDTGFHSESHSTYSPAIGGVSEMTMIVDQKYVGSCPAGQHPGDRTSADGTVIHLGKH